MQGWRRALRIIPLLLAVAAGLSAAVFQPGATSLPKAASAETVTAASPDGALAAFVHTSGAVFAGPCEGTRSPEDFGKVCARFVAERAGVRAYLTGRTFSEFTTWVFVAPSGSGWTVRATAPLDFNAATLTIPWPGEAISYQ